MNRQLNEAEEEIRRNLYNSLNEKDRRRFAGFAAWRYGDGGQSDIAEVLGCSRNTVSQGAQAVSGLTQQEMAKRIRKLGGGRKPYQESWGVERDAQFLEVLKEHTAGDPMDEKVRWTNLTLQEIVKALMADHGIRVSQHVVRQLLQKHNYRRRKAHRKMRLKREIKNRNEQFEHILRLKVEFEAAGNPIVSLATKKKEYLGNFYRDGHLYTLEELQTYAHDFNSYAQGIIIPHTLYDLQLNVGYIQLGPSRATSAFACDSFRDWWCTYGQHIYADATAPRPL